MALADESSEKRTSSIGDSAISYSVAEFVEGDAGATDERLPNKKQNKKRKKQKRKNKKERKRKRKRKTGNKKDK